MTTVSEPILPTSDWAPVTPSVRPPECSPGARAVEQIRSARVLDSGADLLRRLSDRLRLPALAHRGEELLGHPVHPALTDLPIGFWTGSFLLDLIGGPHQAVASRRLVAAGVLTALPTVAFGLGDLPDDGQQRRVATVHAGANAAALVCYLGSWRARRRGHWARGVAMGLAGAAVASVGGYLGGALAFATPDDD